MKCPRCNTTLEENAFFCGNCGVSLQNRRDATTPDNTFLSNGEKDWANLASDNPGTYQTVLGESFVQPTSTKLPVPVRADTPPPQWSRLELSPGLSPRRNLVVRNLLSLAIILLLVAGGTTGYLLTFGKGTIATNEPANPPRILVPHNVASGQVAFFDDPNSTPGSTNALKIAVEGLSAPLVGSHYTAWLINDQSEQITSLGALTQSGTNYLLSFTSGSEGTQQQRNLIGAGNRIEVTLEQGTASQPSGKVLFTGVFPPQAFAHIQHLLFRFPTTPHNIGLLVGLMQQSQALNVQALLLQSLIGSGNIGALQCVAQSIIDISEGSHGAHYQPLSTWCTTPFTSQEGDGFGLLNQGYLAAAADHASYAALQPDATDTIRLHAHHVEIATDNIKGWVTTLNQDTLKLLSNPSDTADVPTIVALSDHAYHGVAGPDGQVNPVPGEAGALTAYLHGQYMATLPLVAGA
jgi:hypothetical protein